MRRLPKQPTGIYDPWDFDIEAGDRLYLPELGNGQEAFIYDVVESKRDAGELTGRLVTKDGHPRIAVVVDGTWYWKD